MKQPLDKRRRRERAAAAGSVRNAPLDEAGACAPNSLCKCAGASNTEAQFNESQRSISSLMLLIFTDRSSVSMFEKFLITL